MTVHFIGAGPGAPDLITLRGRDLIAACPVCLYAGSLVPEEIVAFAPSLYGAIGEQIRRLKTLGIEYTITPGVPAFAACAAALGLELTLPDVSQTVVLTRTAMKSSAMPAGEELENLGRSGATLAVHLSVRNLKKV